MPAGLETGGASERGGPPCAADILPRAVEPPGTGKPSDIVRRAATAARLIRDLRLELAGAWEAHAKEAAIRTELVEALSQAMLAAGAHARRLAEHGYFSAPPPRPSPEPMLLSRLPERALKALGAAGAALRIRRAGLWRSQGEAFLLELRRIRAYVRRGADPAAAPSSLFDQAGYLRDYPDVAATGVSPMMHYLAIGASEGRSPHPLFDADYYARENAAALAGDAVTPLAHFLRAGAWQGRNPHPLFDMAHYAAQAPQLDPGEDMPSHYVRAGWRTGLSPSPLFDPAWYAARAQLSEADGPPLVHYLRQGVARRLSPHPLFDAGWYLERNPDVAAAGHDPLRHFLLVGGAEGRSPGPWFDLPHYVARRGEALAGRNPLVDYLEAGAWVVSEPTPGFATFAYIASHPQLVVEGATPLEHWARRAAG